MKKGTSAIVICFFLILLLPGISKAERFGIKLTAGINYLEVGDPNASLKGFADFLKDWANGGGETIDGGIKKIHFGLDLEGEVVFYLTSRFGISVSSGYIYGNKGVEENKIAFMNQTYSDGMKVSAIPVRLGVYYYLPLSSRIRFFLNGGAGYYFAKWSENYRNEFNSNVFTRDQKAKASGIGFHGGVGFELKLVPHIVFIFEGQGRYVKIGSFKGERDSAGRETTLYYWEQQIFANLDWYPKVDLWPYEPFGVHIRNVREATVDFSGFTFRAGIKINF
jgi:opacity protein-like surface antigen